MNQKFSLRSFLYDLHEARPSQSSYEYGSGTHASVDERPSMESLRRGTVPEPKHSSETSVENENRSSKTLFGMWDGVFVRCMLNIVGVIMFLRLGWMVAYGGVIGSVFIVVISSSITFVTALSLSAICTNGKIAGGGAYYLISRSLGPEFGSSIGVLLYLATATSVSMYLLGFAETLVNQVGHEIFVDGWDERLIAFMGLILIFFLCIVGVSWVVKLEKLLLLLQLSAIVVFLIGVARGPTEDSTISVKEFGPANLYTSWNGEAPDNLKEVFVSGDGVARTCSATVGEVLQDTYGTVDFGVLLAVFFPAVCGIMAGANISGDLKDPSNAIPEGTLLAILSSSVLYIIVVICVGFIAVRSVIDDFDLYADGSSEVKDEVNTTIIELLECEYGGLYFDFLILCKVSVVPSLVYAGIYAATFSSALGAFVGAPRIIQSLSRDRLFPILTPLGKGFGKDDEPLRAYGLTFLIALVCILTGDLNSVAPLITTFFLASYALVNYACFVADTSHSPGWRPSFRFFNPWVALIGAIACIAGMLLLSAIMGFVTFVLGLGLYKYIEVTNCGAAAALSHWGPARESVQYNAALKAALLLEAKEHVEQNFHHNDVLQDATDTIGGSDLASPKETTHLQLSGHQYSDVTHVKNFRPQCLVLAGSVEERPALAVLATGLRKAKGIILFGDVLIGDICQPGMLEKRRRHSMRSYVSEFGIKGFNEVVVAESVRSGARSLLQLGGLGRSMRPNTLVMGYLDTWKDRVDEFDEEKLLSDMAVHVGDEKDTNEITKLQAKEYVGIIEDAFDLGCGVAILRGEYKLLGRDHLKEAAWEAKKSVLMLGNTSKENEREEVPVDTSFVDIRLDDVTNEEVPAPEQEHPNEVGFENPVSKFWGDVTDAPKEVEMKTKSQFTNPIHTSPNKRIDVWWITDDGGLTLMIPHLLRKAKTPPFKGSKLRVMAVGASQEEVEEEKQQMVLLLDKLRISAEVEICRLDLNGNPIDNNQDTIENHSNSTQRRELMYRQIGEKVKVVSMDALLAVVSLPVPPVGLKPEEYMNWMELLSFGVKPPVLFIRGSQREVVTLYG